MGYVSVHYKITSPYGASEPFRAGARHAGIDLQMEVGTKLRSIADGEVLRVFSGNDDIGKGVLILGKDGKEYIYGHMDKVVVKPGEKVGFGELLGESGSTGNSTGPHLHFSIRENGEYIDPTRYKDALDRITGDINPSDLPWYDITGRLELAMENKMEAMKQEAIDTIVAWLQAMVDVVVDLSYSVALVGGGMLILLRVLGMKSATKYFWLLQFTNVMLQMLFRGGVSWDTTRGLLNG